MIRKACFIPFIVLFWFSSILSKNPPLTVAVLDFKDNSPMASEDMKPMQQGLANVMITTLSQIQGVKIVERSQLNSIFEEMSLGQSGMLDESSAQQVGNLLGAHYLVLGSFMKGFKNDIRIDCRIVRTETGITLKAEEVSGSLKDIIKLMSKLGEKVVKGLDIKMNSKEKDAIKMLDGKCSHEVVMEYFKALDLIEEKQYRKAVAMLADVINKCPEFKRAKIARQKMRASLKEKIQKRK